MTVSRTLTSVFVFILVAVLMAGCGEPKFSEVSGTVTYDGKVVEQGSIAFIPVDGGGPSAGSSIENGKYTARRIQPGMAKVTISGARVTSKKMAYDDPNGAGVITSSEYLPEKYNKATELRYEVKSGAQTKDFDLPK